MIRFACPSCDKTLRADEAKANAITKCPSCGHRFPIPSPQSKPASNEDDEPEAAKQPRDKELAASGEGENTADSKQAKSPKKRRKGRKPLQGTRGRGQVITIIGLVTAFDLFILTLYLLVPSSPTHIQVTYNGISLDLIRLLAGFAPHALLFPLLYTRHNWARIALGILFFLNGLYSFVRNGGVFVDIVMNGRVQFIPLALGVLTGVGISFVLSYALLGSEEIKAYTGQT